MARTNKDEVHLRRLRDVYARMGCLPSYGQMAIALGFKAKNSAFKLTQRLINSGHLTKSVGGRLAPGPVFFTMELGDEEIRAGFGADGNGTGLVQAQSLEALLVSRPSKTVLVKVRGESMIDVGIHSGDVAVVEASVQAVHGDIVVAEIDGSHTIKELRINEGRPFLVANGLGKKTLAPQKTLNIIGVVKGIIRSYGHSKGSSAKLAKRELSI